jgi:glycosyltransferase involved in cell wall biosynthesis
VKAKKAIAKTAKKLPITSNYLKKRGRANTIKTQEDEIIGLKEAVDRLEARNDEWAAEVRKLRGEAKSLEILWPVMLEDLIKADWSKPGPPFKPQKTKPPLIINWVVPPMGPMSGGHLNIFRIIAHLESKGHKLNVYFYDPLKQSSLESLKDKLKNYAKIKADIFYNERNMVDCDAIFATSWHTAYPVFNYSGNAKKYYYVQDFEPFFDPVGAYSTLAENTYKFGLRGITFGRWLSDKLPKEYGMQADFVELGCDPNQYFLTNEQPRKKIFFYARPVTPRRGFELGVLALELFHKEHPDYEINFIGWDTSPYNVPFPYKNRGILSQDELNELYNESAVGLVLSLTNMSLLPLEMLAAGCRPIINDAKHTRMVSYADQVCYTRTSPRVIADILYEAISKIDQNSIKEMSASTKDYNWDSLNDVIEEIIEKEVLK